VGWPEKNDCALMSSKGFSTRAARDLIDMLAETDEECEFFCIHDADAAGSMIYQTLQDATRARGARKVRIINLGLDPAEGRRMGLVVEHFEEKDNPLKVADYVPDDDQEWLQGNRIELNAMSTPQFIAWLDAKFEPFRGKLIPPPDVMVSRFDEEVRTRLRDRITRNILDRYDIDELVDRAYDKRSDAIEAAVAALDDRVRASLDRDRSRPWTEPVERAARKAISRSATRPAVD
jgi:hypothetical protein